MKTCNTNRIVQINSYDILCGRGKEAFNNVGNRRLRVTVSIYLARYLAADTRYAKGEVIMDILHVLREESGARFLRPALRGNYYVELSDKEARAKIAHAMRDQMASHKRAARRARTGSCDGKDTTEESEAEALSGSIVPDQAQSISMDTEPHVESSKRLSKVLDDDAFQLTSLDGLLELCREPVGNSTAHTPESLPLSSLDNVLANKVCV